MLLRPHSGCFLETALARAILEQNWPFLGQNWFLLGFFFKKKLPLEPKQNQNCPKLSPKLPTSNTLDPGGSIFTNPELRQIRPLHLQETQPCKSCTTVLVNHLIYADDIVCIAQNEGDLQLLINIVNSWCSKYRIEANLLKTEIMHVRKPLTPRSKVIFKFGHNKVKYCKT